MSAKRKAIDSPGTLSKRARKVLTLADKIRVTNAIDSGKSHRAVTLDFTVGRMQINEISCKCDSIKGMYIEGTNAAVKYLAPRHVIPRDRCRGVGLLLYCQV